MNFLDLEEREITDLITTYESKRDIMKCITFGLAATRSLKGLLRWVQDQRRCGSPIIPSHVNLSLLTQALQQASDRKSIILQKEVNAKISHPGKFSNRQHRKIGIMPSSTIFRYSQELLVFF